jgi:ABC-type nitrate/sulfonate/bicarbonate transport system substrate-binding protein
MPSLTLAYRDDDRTPVICAIRAMAARHYDLDVRVVKIKDGGEYEAALFNGAADVIIEHLEYLYEEAAKGKKVTFFCAPSKGGDLELVVPQSIQNVAELKGKTLAVRSQGQPHAVTLWLKMMGLANDVATVIVHDKDVGRWGQWKKVVSGECVATFMSPLYLSAALNAGLKVLAVPAIPIVGQFAQACLAEFAAKSPELLLTYVKAVVHALVWLTARSQEALTALTPELKTCMQLNDAPELTRRFDSVVSNLKIRPYPTPQAIANTYEIATIEYPVAKGLNPLTLWDLHWVKGLDDAGFIDELVKGTEG